MPGFNGISIQYIVSPKFQQYDGGLDVVVWMGKSIKDRVYDFLPEDIRDKIATEEDVNDVNDLQAWLEEKEHPIIKTEEYQAAIGEGEEEEDEWEEEGGAMIPMGTQAMTIPGAGGSGGFKVILKNCKIHAESVIIKKIDNKRRKKK